MTLKTETQEVEIEFANTFIEREAFPQVINGEKGRAYQHTYKHGNGNSYHSASRSHEIYDSSIKQLPPTEEKYRLAEFARKIGLYPQYILNLISRYGVIHPHKTVEQDFREIYEFTQKEVEQVERLKDLTRRGISIQDAANMLKEDDGYRQAADELMQILIEWAQSRDPKTWEKVIRAICKSPILDESESRVLLLVEGYGRSLGQCILELEVNSEKEVKNILHSAYSKLGFPLLYLFRKSLKV